MALPNNTLSFPLPLALAMDAINWRDDILSRADLASFKTSSETPAHAISQSTINNIVSHVCN